MFLCVFLYVCTSLSVGFCVNSAASFWLFYSTQSILTRLWSDWRLWPILLLDWRIRSTAQHWSNEAFSIPSSRKGFAGVPRAHLSCRLLSELCYVTSVNVFMGIWIISIFVQKNVLRQDSPMQTWQRWSNILYDCHLGCNVCSNKKKKKKQTEVWRS